MNEDGAADCVKYFYDADGDGFGDSNNWKCKCLPSAPYSAPASGDCDDSRDFIYPGAKEICNGFDDNCNGSTDTNEVPLSTLCPAVANAASQCAGLSGCQIVSCDSGWYDLNGVYSDGCEVQEDSGDLSGRGDSCSDRIGLGLLQIGSSLQVQGNMLPAGESDWYTVSEGTSTTQRVFDIRFLSNPLTGYQIDVYSTDCATQIAAGVTSLQRSTLGKTYIIRVFRPDGQASADSYTLQFSYGVY
nr:putative metal-binding motif-containing protein [Geothermobacter hydrogeniphilus]